MKIAKSLAVIAFVVVAAAGATYALYHDEGTIAGATFSTDNMDLKIDSNPSGSTYDWVDSFDASGYPFAKLKPGSTGNQIIDIKNVGGVRGNATIKLHVIADTPLYHNMNFVVKFDPDHDGDFDSTVASGALTDWNNNTYSMGEIIGHAGDDVGEGVAASVLIEWSVPVSAGNDIMGTNVVIDTTFGLDQISE